MYVRSSGLTLSLPNKTRTPTQIKQEQQKRQSALMKSKLFPDLDFDPRVVPRFDSTRSIQGK